MNADELVLEPATVVPAALPHAKAKKEVDPGLAEVEKNWNEFGKRDPLWAILTDESKRDNKWDLADFFATGEREIKGVMQNVDALGHTFARRTALDFGCGVGRLTQALCRHFKECHGIDIAESMVEQARQHNRYGNRCHYHVNRQPDLSLFANDTFDFVYTNIVLQHNPPAMSRRFIQEFLRILTPNGLLVFQMPSELIQSSQGEGRTLPDRAFKAQIRLVEKELEFIAGTARKLSVTIKNLSTETWLGSKESGKFPVRLGNHWRDAANRMLINDDARADLPRALKPGEEITLSLSVTVPGVPGRYRLELDLVQEMVAWFGGKGSATLMLDVAVKAKSNSSPGGTSPVRPDDMVDVVQEMVSWFGDKKSAAPQANPAKSDGAAGALIPRMEMNGIPKKEMLAFLAANGAKVIRVEEDTGATGWLGFRYYVTKEKVSEKTSAEAKSEPKFAEDILRSLRGRVAIVGNATPKHSFGEIIDGYDIVIRLNNFRTAGFEKLVGTKTSYRCTSGWPDIEHRNEHIEFSPFTANSAESAHLETFNQGNGGRVLPAAIDIHPLIPEIPKPSTGLSLIQLCSKLGIPVDLFGFDGFKTPHYWEKETPNYTTHSQSEIDAIRSRPGVRVFGDENAHDVKTLSDAPTSAKSLSENDQFYVNLFIENPDWSTPHPNEDELARWEKISQIIKNVLTRPTTGARLRILDVGCGRGWLTNLASAYGDSEGVEPVAAVVEQARKLFPGRRFTAGTVNTILDAPDFQPYDLILTSEVIEHVPREAQPEFARNLSRLLKPGGQVILTTPRGEALEEWTRLAGDPSQPVEDWLQEAELQALFVREQFIVSERERVLFDTRARKYVLRTPASGDNNLLPIYQVWGFQKPTSQPTQASISEASAHSRQAAIAASEKRKAGYSFCIITNGKRPQKLAEEIASIRALQIPQFEILVGGDVPAGLTGVTILSLPEAAQGGRLGEMRNRLIEISRYDHLVIADDDLLFKEDFYDGLRKYGEDFDVLCVRFLNADGTRYWDWATVGGPRGHALLDYAETDSHVYVTGGLCIMKAWVAAQVQWDGQRGFYQSEDVDFSRRLHESGVSIKFNRFSTVVHTDVRYTQVNQVIMTAETLRASVIAKVGDGKFDEARALLEYLRKLDPTVAEEVEQATHPALSPVEKQLELTLPVRWRGPIFNPSGYASEAINYLLPLSECISDLGIFHLNNNYSEKFVAGLSMVDRGRLFALRDKYAQIKGGIVIDHNPANGFAYVSDAAYRIGRTMFETDRISPAWVNACNQMDEVWVPSQFNVETFAASGVERDRLVAMPESVDENEFNPDRHEPLPLPNRAKFNFLAIFEWSRRKGWDVLLSAYLREFSAADDVCLYLRTYLFSRPDGEPREAIQRLIDEHAATLNLGDKVLPRIHIIAEQVAQADLPRLYKAADCLVAPSRGEGWGRPHHEAMMMGLPVIATNWSGNTEFMNAANSYLVDYELGETLALDPELRHYRGHRWANPSEKSLREQMRKVQQHPILARAKGMHARRDMLKKYSRGPVTKLVVARLLEIERKLSTPVCPEATARVANHSTERPAQKTQHLQVAWEGSFLDFGSLSHVNRELTHALGGDAKVHLTRVGNAALPTPLEGVSELKNLSRKIESTSPRKVDVTVRHAWPPNWQRPANGAWVLIQPWEFGVLPADWVQKLTAVDEVWAPTEHVRKVYVESGIHPSKVKVVPNGIDPQKFNPNAKPLKLATQKKFKFLFVGGTIQRKGPDVLLKSYLETFTAADDVCLVIKDFGSQSIYRGQTFEKQIAAARQNPNAPEILYLTDEMAPEQMPGLYTACDCLLHPYRGEGFGLPVLEAMACGLPVVVTGGGATDDFATDEYAYRLPALKKLIGENIGGMKLQRNGWWLEPQIETLNERIKWIFENRDAAQAKGKAASEYVRREWTWERAAKIVGQRLQEVAVNKQAQVAAVAERRARKAQAITLPDVAKLGQLSEAREFLSKKNFPAAWNSANAALEIRPFHCEAYLLLAEIAKAAGDLQKAKVCAGYANQLAPKWKPTKQFLKGNFSASRTLEWTTFSEPRKTPHLSVCLIVRNEEKFLAKCLESVRGIAQQIVVVDTGSTDATIEIARKFNAEVHAFKWNEDFSAARNEALKHATGDWILFLDADEELLPEHRATLTHELQAVEVMAYRLPIIDIGREHEGNSFVPRLFRNAPGLFFIGRVHEQIFSSIEVRCREWGMTNRHGESTLLHHGYVKEVVVSRDKIARNLRLLELAIEELPNEPNLLMNFGLELVRSGQLEAGLEQTLEAFHLLSALPADQVVPELRETLFTQLGTHLFAGKCYDEVVKIWQTPFGKATKATASQHFILGLSHMELKQPKEAAEHMRQCLAQRGQKTLSPINPEILKAGPNHCLALSLVALKDLNGAVTAFQAALKDDPNARVVRFDLARFYAQQGQPVEALKLLHALTAENADDLACWEFGGQIALGQAEFLDFAQNWTAEAVRHFPMSAPILLQRAEALLLSQQIPAALSVWTNLGPAKSAKQLAALALCEVANGAGQRRFTAADENVVSQEFLNWYRKLIKFNAYALVNQINARMEALRAVLPSAAGALEKVLKRAPEPVTV